ncbi:unnamed protein product, partial [Polarella glacialis]
MAVSLESFRLKDPCEWTPPEVCDFLAVILPGHPSLENFTYTSGYVLCSLDKEDIRRQAKSQEAANIIWAELSTRRRGATQAPQGGNCQAFVQRGGVDPRSFITIYVKAARQDAALELELCPTETVAFLKAQISIHEGTPVESQRLVAGGMTMQ